MNELPAALPAAGVVRVVGPEEAGAGFLVSASGLIVTCAHVLAGCVHGATVGIESYAAGGSLSATVDLLQDPPDVAVLRLTVPVPSRAVVLPLGRSPRTPQPGLRTFGYPQMRPEAGLPGELAFFGVTAAAGYDQLALRSEEATLGFSGAPIWDPELGVVVGMVKSIARADPGQRLGNTAIGVPVEVIRDLCPELRLPVDCPYRGLEPFTEEHVDYYNGREHATSQLLTSLAARNFVPVVAVSGGGKSSLLQAGLAKGLRDRPVVGLVQRIRCYQRVNSQPHAELFHSLAKHGIFLPEEKVAAPAHELAAQIRGAVPATELIVVVDQFERLYTDCEVAERKRFVELLIRLASGTVKVVIGLRADFYHLALADLGEQLAAGQVALAPMSEQDLGRAIAAPAAKLLRSLQPGLTQQLIADVRGRPGDLPLLQFALTELWERDAAGGVLTEETYQSLGVELPDGTHLPGAQGALIRRAEQLWQDLGAADQLRLQRILLGLIVAQPVETSTADLLADARDLSRPARLAQWDEDDQWLVQRLIDARLLTADKASAGGQPTVEVSHEALLRSWPRLRSWLEERSHFVQWRAQDLAPSLERWLDSNKNPEFLLPRSLLDPALRWLHDYPDELAGPPAGYIQASRRHRVRRRRLVSGAVAVLVVASLVAVGIFYSLQQTAVQRQNTAVSRLLIIEGETLSDTDPDLSKLLSIASWRLNHSSDARYAMLAAAARPEIGLLTAASSVESAAFSRDGKVLATGDYHGTVELWDAATHHQIGSLLTAAGPVRSLALSPDDTMLATGNGDGTARLWDVATHHQIGALPTGSGSAGGVLSMAFSPDGTVLATAGNPDGTTQLWDVATHHQIGRPLTGSNGSVLSVAFSPDGTVLATGSLDGMVRLWDVATHHQIGSPLTVSAARVWSVAFSPDGTVLATGSDDGTTRLWDVATHHQIGSPLTGSASPVQSVAFSPDGTVLATGSDDGTTRLWDVATHHQIGSPPAGSASPVRSVAFSPDGTVLATGSTDGTTWLWDVGSLTGIATFTVSAARVWSVAFSPDGTVLATGSDDGTTRLWDVATHHQIGRPPAGSASRVQSVAFSPDGTMLATTGDDGTTRLWDVATHRQIGRPLTAPGFFLSVAFSPDGTMLATTGDDGTARLWDVATHRQIGDPLTVSASSAGSLAFSPDSTMLATTGDDGTLQLWDVATHRQIGDPLTAAGSVESLAFSPDSTMLATTGGYGGTAQLWDVATHRQIGDPLTAAGSVESLAFSPDGTVLATGGDDGTVRLWDVAAHRQIGDPLTVSASPVGSLAFSRDGTMLAAGTDDGMARLLDVAYLGDVVPYLCASARRSLTPTEWARYAPGTAYQDICP